MNKKNSNRDDKECTPNQHGVSRVTYTVDESGSAIIDGSILNTDAANTNAVAIPGKQIEIRNQEDVDDEQLDETDEHAMYQQLLQDFMSAQPCRNSATVIDEEMYRNNQIMKSMSINQRNG